MDDDEHRFIDETRYTDAGETAKRKKKPTRLGRYIVYTTCACMALIALCALYASSGATYSLFELERLRSDSDEADDRLDALNSSVAVLVEDAAGLQNATSIIEAQLTALASGLECANCSAGTLSVFNNLHVRGGAVVEDALCVGPPALCLSRRRAPAATAPGLVVQRDALLHGNVTALGAAHALAGTTNLSLVLLGVEIVAPNGTGTFLMVYTLLNLEMAVLNLTAEAAANSFRGTWSGARTYSPLDVVQLNYSIWVANATSTGQQPGNGSSWVQISGTGGPTTNVFTGRGPWDGAANYTDGDYVSYMNATYLALANNTGVAPDSDPAVWGRLTGATGAAGASGPAGPPGINGTDGANGINGTAGANGINGTDGVNGINGTDGANGINGTDGANAYTSLDACCSYSGVYPGGVVNATVADATPFAAGMAVFIDGAGGFLVLSTAPSQLVLRYMGAALALSFGPPALVTQSALPAATPCLADFTMPAGGSNVTVSVGFSGWAARGQAVYVTGIGYFIVADVPSATALVLTNTGAAGNLAPASTAPCNTTQISPAGPTGATGAAGTSLTNGGAWDNATTYPPLTVVSHNSSAFVSLAASTGVEPGTNTTVWIEIGVSGADGNDAYTTLAAAFTVPATNATVTVFVASSEWMVPGQVVVTNGTYFLVLSKPNITSAVLAALGYEGGTPAGGTVPGGAGVSPGGYRGPAGDRAYSATTAAFTTPAANASVAILVDATGWMSAGQPLYIGGAGMYQVVSITNATSAVVYNLGYENNTAAGAVISSGALVSAGGFSGPQGAQGPTGGTGGTGPAGPAGPAGGNAYTNTTAVFTVPAANTTVEILVLSTAWMSANQPVFIQGAGMYQVISITNATSAVVYNLGYENNTAPAAVISSGALVSAGGFSGPQGAQGPTGGTGSTGPAGPAGGNAYTNTTAAFTVPAASASVTILVLSTSWMSANQPVFIQGAGTYQVTAVVNASAATVLNLGYTNNTAAGAVIAAGALVSAGGFTGPSGSSGNSTGLILVTDAFTVPAGGGSFSVKVNHATGIREPSSVVSLNIERMAQIVLISKQGYTAGYHYVVDVVNSTLITLKPAFYKTNISPSYSELYSFVAGDPFVITVQAETPMAAGGAKGTICPSANTTGLGAYSVANTASPQFVDFFVEGGHDYVDASDFKTLQFMVCTNGNCSSLVDSKNSDALGVCPVGGWEPENQVGSGADAVAELRLYPGYWEFGYRIEYVFCYKAAPAPIIYNWFEDQNGNELATTTTLLVHTADTNEDSATAYAHETRFFNSTARIKLKMQYLGFVGTPLDNNCTGFLFPCVAGTTMCAYIGGGSVYSTRLY